MLSEQTDWEVIGDTASISAAKAAERWEQNRIRLRTLSRSTQKTQPSPVYQHIHKTIRQLIETVNGQVSDQFAIEKNYAHPFWGWCTRFDQQVDCTSLVHFYQSLVRPARFPSDQSTGFPKLA